MRGVKKEEEEVPWIQFAGWTINKCFCVVSRQGGGSAGNISEWVLNKIKYGVYEEYQKSNFIIRYAAL